MERAEQRLRLLELAAGDVGLAAAELDVLADVGERVALAADLGAARRRDPRRVDDRRVARTAQVQPVAAQRILVGGDVGLGRAVAGLARDAVLAEHALDLPAAAGEQRERLTRGGVAPETADVPHLLVVVVLLGRMEEHLAANNVNLHHSPLILGRLLKMNPASERFIDNREADQMLTREYRKPFVVPEKV